MTDTEYELVVGLEVHIQLNTESKMFCGCSNNALQAEPNTLLCPVCFGMPGTLPVANKAAIHKTLILGKALRSELNTLWNFERKNYFYPDLPKGYQITSATNPPLIGGSVDVPGFEDKGAIRIHHVHLEEDAGKLTHGSEGYSYVDLNRAGTPLLEMVSEPDFRSAAQVKAFLQEMQLLVRTLEISAGDMESGHLRCDANVSVRKAGETFGPRVEIKNLNSFSMVEKAITYEYNRQVEAREKSQVVVQETRSWDEVKMLTTPLRSKEEAQDYRYMPEPDLPPIERLLVPEFTEAALDADMQQYELPAAKRTRLASDYSLSSEHIELLLHDQYFARFAEGALEKSDPSLLDTIKALLFGDIIRIATQESISFEHLHLSPDDLLVISHAIQEKTLTQQLLKTSIADLLLGKRTITDCLAQAKAATSINVESIIDEVMQEKASVVEEWRNGNERVYGFLVGQVMAKSNGQADPQKINEILKNKLGKQS